MQPPSDGRELYDLITGSVDRRSFAEALDHCNRLAKSDAKSIITDATNLVCDVRGNMLLHRLASVVPVEDASDRTQRALYRDVLQFFLKRRAPVVARNCRGQTPLHVAAASGNDVACEILLKFKSDIVAKDARLKLPEQLAEHANHRALAESLKQQRHALQIDDEVFLSTANSSNAGEAESELDKIVAIKTGELQKRVADMEVNEEHLQQEVRKLKKERKETTAAKDSEIETLRTERVNLEAENLRLSQQLAEKEKLVSRQTREIRESRTKLEAVFGSSSMAEGAAKLDVKGFQERAELSQTELRTLRRQCESLTEQRNALEVCERELSDKVQELEAKLGLSKNENSDLSLAWEEARQRFDAALNDSTAKAVKAQAALAEAMKELSALKTEQTVMKMRLTDATKEAEIANQRIAELLESVSPSLLDPVKKATPQEQVLEAATDDLKRRLQIAEAEAAQLRRDTETGRQEVYALANEVNRLRNSLAVAEGSASALKDELYAARCDANGATDLRQDNEALSALLAETQQKLKASELQFAEQKATTEAAVREGTAVLAEVTLQRDTCAKLQAELLSHQQQVANLTHERVTLVAALAQSEAKNSDGGALSQLQDLRVEFAAASAKLEVSLRELERMDARVSRAERQKDASDERLIRAEAACEELKERLQRAERERDEAALRLSSGEKQQADAQKLMTEELKKLREEAMESRNASLESAKRLGDEKKRADELERSRASLSSQMTAVELSLSTAQEEKRECQRKIKSIEERQASENRDSETAIAGERKRTDEALRERNELRRQLDDSRRLVEQLSLEKDTLEDDRTRLLERLTSTSPRRSLFPDHDALTNRGVAEIAELQSQLLQARADIEYLQRSLKNSAETIHHKDVSIEALERQLLLLPKDVTDLNARLEEAVRHKDTALAEAARLLGENVVLREANERGQLDHQTTTTKLQLEIAALNQAAAASHSAVAPSEIEALKMQLLNANATIRDLTSNEATSKKMLDDSLVGMAAMKGEVKRLEGLRDAMTTRVESLQRQLQAVMQQVLERDGSLSLTAATEKALRDELSQLKRVAESQEKRIALDAARSRHTSAVQLLIETERAERAVVREEQATGRMLLHHTIAELVMRAAFASALERRHQHHYGPPSPSGSSTGSVRSHTGRTVLELRQLHAMPHSAAAAAVDVDHEIDIRTDCSDADEPNISPTPPAAAAAGSHDKLFVRDQQRHQLAGGGGASRSRSAESEADIVIEVPPSANFEMVKIGGLHFSTTPFPALFYKQQCILHQVRPIDHVLKQLHNNPDSRHSILSIDVSGCSLTRGAARAAVDLLFVCPAIERLDMSRNFLPDNAAEYLRFVVTAVKQHNGSRAIVLKEVIFDGNLLASTNALAELCDLVPTLSSISVASSPLLSQSSQAALQAKLERRAGDGFAVGALESLVPIRPMLRSRPASATRTPYTLRPPAL